MPNNLLARPLEEYLDALIDYRGKTPRKVGVGIPLITAKVVKSGRIERPEEFIAEEDYEAWMTRGFPEIGDVVLTTEAPLGQVAQIKFVPVALAQRIITLRGKKGVLDSGYLLHLLQSTQMQEKLIGRSSGTTVTGIKQSELRKIEVLLPPLDEQLAIAHILGTLDDKIELNQRANQTLEAMARALFKAWFVDFEPVCAKIEGRWLRGQSLPGLPAHLYDIFPDRLVASTLGDIPAGWQVIPLDEIADFLNGLALQKFPVTNSADSLPVIKIAELRNGISHKSDRASRDVPKKYVIRDGDFLLSWSGSLFAKFWTEGEGALNQHLFKVTSERVPMWFASQWVYHHLEDFQSIAASKATTMGHIQRGHLKLAMTICPDQDALKKFDFVMAPLIDHAIQNALESRSLVALRDALLPELVSGKVRVKDTERIVNAAI